jgi:pimeloyl-ACP methyl ester carboxylesterase
MLFKKRWQKVVLIIVVVGIVAEIILVQWYNVRRKTFTPEGLVRHVEKTQTPWEISYLANAELDDSLPRIIYVHGTPGSARAFVDYVQNPLPGLNPISIDRPGFGGTTPHKPAMTLLEQSQVIEPFLVQRGGRWPILVGHSMGGPIVARVAVDYPDKVGGLVILSGSLDPALEKIHWYQRIAKFLFVPYMLPTSIRYSNEELYPLKRELEILKPLLASIKCPVVIAHAPDDMLVPYENVAFMKSQIPKDRIHSVIELPDKNHFIPWNSEKEIRTAITSLMDTMSKSNSTSVDQNGGLP